MNLPPGFLDDLRTRISLSQVVGRKVTWDTRKSNPGKGDLWAPCPFHQEKSASFHVDDRKGFYYCFGCHAKGDAVSFVKETENVGFMEAVEILAREAGMPMPARDPRGRPEGRPPHRTGAGDGRGGQVVPPAAENQRRRRGAGLSAHKRGLSEAARTAGRSALRRTTARRCFRR